MTYLARLLCTLSAVQKIYSGFRAGNAKTGTAFTPNWYRKQRWGTECSI